MNYKLKTEKAKIELSLGQRRTRVNFNPSDNTLVNDIKKRSAHLIDLAEEIADGPSTEGDPDDWIDERRRLISLAQTAYEEAAMWAVKAATL